MSRQFKQASIVFVIVLVIVAILGVLYWFFLRPVANCTDGIQNQDEAGIDCGGACTQVCESQYVKEQLKIEEKGILSDTADTSDFYATVTNPNATAAVKEANYTFAVTDGSGKQTTVASGTFTLLPKETKSVLAIAVPHVTHPGENMTFTMADITWVPLDNYSGKPTINVYQKRYSEISSGPGFAEVQALVSNESPYDFRDIGVNVILRNSAHVPIAVNKTVLHTVQAGEQRDFRLVWPTRFPGEVNEVETQIDINPLAEDAFVKKENPGGKFQDLGPSK